MQETSSVIVTQIELRLKGARSKDFLQIVHTWFLHVLYKYVFTSLGCVHKLCIYTLPQLFTQYNKVKRVCSRQYMQGRVDNMEQMDIIKRKYVSVCVVCLYDDKRRCTSRRAQSRFSTGIIIIIHGYIFSLTLIFTTTI